MHSPLTTHQFVFNVFVKPNKTINCHSILSDLVGRLASEYLKHQDRVLAKRGVRIVILARDLKRAAEVKEGIQRESPEAEIILFEIDLSSLTSVKRFCYDFLALGLPLNILIAHVESVAPAVSDAATLAVAASVTDKQIIVAVAVIVLALTVLTVSFLSIVALVAAAVLLVIAFTIILVVVILIEVSILSIGALTAFAVVVATQKTGTLAVAALAAAQATVALATGVQAARAEGARALAEAFLNVAGITPPAGAVNEEEEGEIHAVGGGIAKEPISAAATLASTAYATGAQLIIALIVIILAITILAMSIISVFYTGCSRPDSHYSDSRCACRRHLSSCSSGCHSGHRSSAIPSISWDSNKKEEEGEIHAVGGGIAKEPVSSVAATLASVACDIGAQLIIALKVTILSITILVMSILSVFTLVAVALMVVAQTVGAHATDALAVAQATATLAIGAAFPPRR
ncbi:hypothetical protein LWI29_016723 [Acer saccharum]|uniref:Uncharacterized protein n=1 Tax=Acer saccharum TaxID=4024 RepID=A0AA39S992_ACESA|nr:hypothetical protein LWI29_016723 [Acer saccharum]